MHLAYTLSTPPPPSYEATYRRFAREGARVIALAWRAVPAPAPLVSKVRRDRGLRAMAV